MRSSPQTKLRNCKLYHLRLNCFSEQVSNILASWNINRTDQRLLHCISEPVQPQIQVLHPSMMLRILWDINARLVVDKECWGVGRWIAKLSQDVPHPLDLLSCLNCCNVRNEAHFLLLRRSWNQTRQVWARGERSLDRIAVFHVEAL